MAKYVSQYVSEKLYGKKTGFYVKSAVPTSYIAVVEAFGTKRADFATLTTFAYILTKHIKNYDIEAILTVVRGEERTYKSQIITHVDSGINTLEDLKGKKFAYSDPGSTSGYILPSQLLADKGIELGDTVFAHKHPNVVTMVYQQQVDAGATYYSSPREEIVDGKKKSVIRDARSRVVTQFPDVEKKVKILSFSEDVPNEPWVIRGKLYEDEAKNKTMKALIKEAIVAFGKTEGGKVALEEIASASGIVEAQDEIYHGIRDMTMATNLNVEELIAKKSAKKKKK